VAAVENAPALAGGLSNLGIQQQARSGANLAGLPGAPLDNQTRQGIARAGGLAGASQSLPHLDRIQASFGRHDVSSVRTITGGTARDVNAALGARAVTFDGRIAFRSTPDVRLAAHESAHIIQQRDGANKPGGGNGDPWEHHADRVADAVVAGRSAEPLLDAVTAGGTDRAPAVQLDPEKHPDNSSEHFVASSADNPGIKWLGRPTVQEWMREWGDVLVMKLAGYLAETSFTMPSAFAQWGAGSPKDFATAVWAPMLGMKASTGKPYSELGRIIVPDALDPLVNAGRDAPLRGPVDPDSDTQPPPRGTSFWAEAVVAEVGKIVVKRVIESLSREVPRWIAARNQLDLSSKGPAKTADRDPEPKEVIASHPMDSYVLAGLKGHVTVDLAAYRKLNPDQAQLGDMHLGELELVPYRWLHDQGAWNWIEVLVPGATAEDVAYTLYGDSKYAYGITAAPPMFGITDTKNLSDAVRSEYDAKANKAKTQPSAGDDNDINAPEQQIQAPSLLSDQVMLAQANAVKSIKPSGIKPDEDGRKVLLDRMNASLQTFQLIHKTSAKMPRGGYESLLDQAYKRLQDRAFKVADRNNSMSWIVDWDRQTQAQNDLLRQALNGITVAVAQYATFSMWETSKTVTQQIGWMYLKVASLSEQAVAGQEALAAANDQSKLFPVTVMELVLAEVRKVLHTERGAKWDDDPANHDERTDLADHEAREAKLRLALARVRDKLLQNQKDAGAELVKLQAELAALQAEVAIVYDMDTIEEAWQALYNDLSMVGVISGSNTDDSELMSGSSGHDAKSNPALLDLWAEWNQIYRQYKKGDQKGAIARLNERRPTLMKLLQKVEPLIKSNATKNKWITFAILVGVAIVTAGVGAYVEGAAAAWGAESWATFAVTTGAEAFTFTTLSYGFVEKNPTIGGYFIELGKSLVMFGALKGISNKYVSWIGKDVAGTVDTMIVQFVALNTASLVEADLKKYLTTKEHLTLDEALEISKQNALFMIASGIAARAAKPGLEALKLQGIADSSLARLRSTKSELKALALKVESAKVRDPAQVEVLLAKQREVAKAQDEALLNLEKLAANPKTKGKAGLDDPKILEQLADARAAHAETVRELELATALQNTEGAGPIRYAEKGGKWDQVVQFWKGQEATVEPVPVDSQFDSRAVDITTKDGETFRLLERTAENAKAVNQTAISVGGAETVAPPSTDTAGQPAPGGTKSASSYTLSDAPVQSGKTVAAVARDLAPGLASEGIELGAAKAEAAKSGIGTRASTTLTVPTAGGGKMTVPVTIEVAPNVAESAGGSHGADAGHASFQIRSDGKGGWSVSIRIEERLASEADVASNLRHELREASEILGELSRDSAFDVDAAQRASSLEDPATATPHDRAAAKELRDLASELGGTIAEGEAARQRMAGSNKGGNAKDRALVAKGDNARARLDRLLDSMGLTDPVARAEKIKTILELAGADASGPLGKFLEGYAQRTDANAARTTALDALDPATRQKVMDAIGPYADAVPPESIPAIVDAVTKGNAAKVTELVKASAAGIIDQPQLAGALDTTAREARAAEAETNEAGGKRWYKAKDPAGHDIRGDGLSKAQDDAFRARIDAAETRERAMAVAEKTGTTADPADQAAESSLDVRYERYLAKLKNAVSLKAGEPMSRAEWEKANPQLKGATKEGRDIEAQAIVAAGATVSNNASNQYNQTTYYDAPTNSVVTARADAFVGDTPVESKYVDANSVEQTVYDTAQTRAERAQGGDAGHIMVLSQKVPAGQPPASLKPSAPLARESTVYFFDPGQNAITYKWNKITSTWGEYSGPITP
jgi:hypothetical protein